MQNLSPLDVQSIYKSKSFDRRSGALAAKLLDCKSFKSFRFPDCRLPHAAEKEASSRKACKGEREREQASLLRLGKDAVIGTREKQILLLQRRSSSTAQRPCLLAGRGCAALCHGQMVVGPACFSAPCTGDVEKKALGEIRGASMRRPRQPQSASPASRSLTTKRNEGRYRLQLLPD